MDVTCERCSTAYEFDDALVSERGTTVKCTSCGHQFKVRRPQPVGAPERWLVRTIDGRELEFKALRELQSAIAQATITRDDVLSRGGSRPRRLGSIAELEPFFVSAGATAARATSLGLGPRGSAAASPGGPARARMPSAPNRTEVSVAIPLPRGPEGAAAPVIVGDPARAQAPTKLSPRPASVPPPPRRMPSIPPPDVDSRGHVAHIPHAARTPHTPLSFEGSALRPPGVVIGGLGAPPVPTIVDPEGFDDEPTRAESQSVNPDPLPSFPLGSGVAVAAAHGHGFEEDEPTQAIEQIEAPNGHAIPQPSLSSIGASGASSGDEWPAEAPPPPPPRGRLPSVPPPRPPPPRAPFLSAPPAPPSPIPVGGGEEWPSDTHEPALEQHTASVPPLTPTPAAIRHSYEEDLVEPRFSSGAPPQRSGAPRWIAAVVVVGMIALAGATVGRRLLVPGAGPAPVASTDARLGALLADGEKSLADGDLESAKEQFDKASMIGDRDARTAADLARLATAKADIDWLRQKLLAADDPEQANAKREVEASAARARKAADRASELGPTDPSVLRSRIDALRVSGDVAGASKLVAGIAAASSQPDNALTLAELNLCEAKPEWPTVQSRLRSALATDGNLGRARALLVFALARSGDVSGARAELDRLAALGRPHPLLGALRAFVSRSASSTGAGLDGGVPDVNAKPDAGAARGYGSREPYPRSGSREPSEPREIAPTREIATTREIPATPPASERPATGPIDTSDLPGINVPPTPPVTPPSNPVTPPAAPSTPPATPTSKPATPTPAPIDTSDLPGIK